MIQTLYILATVALAQDPATLPQPPLEPGPVEPPPSAAIAQRVEGHFVDAAGADVAGVYVEFAGPNDELLTVTTDATGRLALDLPAPGRWTVMAFPGGYEPILADVQVVSGEVTAVNVALVTSAEEDGGRTGPEVIVVVDDKPVIEVTRRVMSIQEITVLPGSNGDAVKSVQNLPGVARAPFNIGQLIIRGTAPEESAAYIDGQRIPVVFHFAGLSTALNSELLDEVALLNGGFSVRYGRALGGVVELGTTSKLPEESRSSLAIDVFQTTAFTSQRVSESTAITFSARRSYIDAVLNPVLSGANTTVRAPRYFDFQARVQHQTKNGGMLDALFFNSYDKFKIVGKDENGEAAAAIAFGTYFEKLKLSADQPLGRGVSSETSILAGPEVQTFSLGGENEGREAPFLVGVRQEFARAPTSSRPGFRVGADVQFARWVYVYEFPDFDTFEKDTALSVAPGVYAEATFQPGRFDFIPGVRVDPWFVGNDYADVAVDPRLVVRAHPGPNTLVKAFGGQFSQFPSPRQVLPGTDGDPSLRPQHALQTGLGVEQTIGLVTVDVTAFRTDLYGLVSGGEDKIRFYTGPPPTGPLDTGAYANDGTGLVYGAEGLLRYADERTAALISATYSRSERTKRPGQESALFTYDQPINVTLLGTRDFGRGYRLGGRLRYGSGIPYTKVTNAFQDLDSRGYEPVYGPAGSDRLPPYFAIDVRFDKTWTFDRWALTAYVDAQNVTNHKNVDWMGFTEDYRSEQPIAGLPTVPTFGFKGEW